jgi:hypothetical protein
VKKSMFLSVVCALFAFATPAAAQTVCPAGQSGATVRSNAPMSFAWCALPDPAISGAYVYGLTTAKQPLSNVRVVGGPFSDGLVQLQGDVVTGVAKGNYSVTFTQTAVDPNFGGVVESKPTSPFALSVVDPMVLPAPLNLRVR